MSYDQVILMNTQQQDYSHGPLEDQRQIGLRAGVVRR